MKIVSFNGAVCVAAIVAAAQFAGFADAQPVPPGVIPVPPVPKNPPGVPHDDSLMTSGTWTYPGMDDIDAAYPKKAQADEIEGQATIYCDVTPSGRLAGCVIVSETPADYGFGAATVALYQAHCYVDPASVPGGIKPGAHFKTTMRWQLG